MRAGERQEAILQVLAAMLEQPHTEKITTAALARRLNVSEAALYRHFASKAQMYEGLIEFIESTLFTRINRIIAEPQGGIAQVAAILHLLLGFAERNPGMIRVLSGEALLHEDQRLQVRVGKLIDRIEATLRQCLRLATTAGELSANFGAPYYVETLLSFVLGKWQLYVRSGFRRAPLAGWDTQWEILRPPALVPELSSPGSV